MNAALINCKLLILGDAVAPTGFARVIYEIISPLVSDFEIYQLGVNYQGDAHHWPWKIYKAHEKNGPFGIDILPDMLEEIKPGLIFILGDDLIFTEWMHIIENWSGRKNAKVIVYFPVDSHPIVPAAARSLTLADRLFTFTHFGKKCIQKSFEREACKENVRIEVIPHGISSSDFYPIHKDIHYHLSPEGRLQAKRNLFGNNTQFEHSFIVLNANRNQERKRQDITIRGFAIFAANKPASVRLYLHCGIKDLGWSVIDLAQREGIIDRLILTTDKPGKPSVSNAELNTIYNACEVGINTSSCEGWGLVSFEHAAAGGAQIVPDHTGPGEIWVQCAEMLTPCTSITDMDRLTEQYIISPDTVADSLEKLYNNQNHYFNMSIAAYEKATGSQYSWKTISTQWKTIFMEEQAKLHSKTGHKLSSIS